MSDTKHGWVTPRADGARARCGGPAICGTCQTEQMHETMLNRPLWGESRGPAAPDPEAVRNRALEEAAVIVETAPDYLRDSSFNGAARAIRALKTQADKDGGDWEPLTLQQIVADMRNFGRADGFGWPDPDCAKGAGLNSRCIAIGPVMDGPLRKYNDHARAVANRDLTFVMTIGGDVSETDLTPEEYEVVYRVLNRALGHRRPALPSEFIGQSLYDERIREGWTREMVHFGGPGENTCFGLEWVPPTSSGDKP